MELLAYTSDAAPGVDASDVFSIVAVSVRNNVNTGLTGVLFFKEARFLQILEGPKSEIAQVMERLAKDSRHTNIRTIGRMPIAARQFPEWNMKRVFNLSAEDEAAGLQSRLAKLPLGGEFDKELSKFFGTGEQRAA